MNGRAGDATPLSPLAWQQRIEDALRGAHFGPPQRVVLLRKLQVRAGSAASLAAPGWSNVIEAACHDALARACHGRSAGAAQADAVWFTDWDDAVGAWLDAALGGPAHEAAHGVAHGAGGSAWYWSRIARLAGLAPRVARSMGERPSPLSAATLDAARAMWAHWAADPASQRARSAWLAERPAWRALLSPITSPLTPSAALPLTQSVTPPNVALVGDAASGRTTMAAHDARGSTNSLSTPPTAAAATTRPAAAAESAPRGAEGAARAAAADGAANEVPPHAAAAQSAAPRHPQSAPADLSTAARSAADAAAPVSPGSDDGHDAPDARVAPDACAARDAAPAAARLRADVPPSPRPQPPHESTSHVLGGALGWARLHPTELGGAPLLVNALQRLGYAPAPDADAIAASAPWLAVWSRLGAAARARWVRDPMFAALPACDVLAAVPAHEWAAALLMRWQAQPPAVRRQGRRMWRQLQRAAQASGWRSPRALLLRPAWMQLSATHLDVLFALDQADLAVRRRGLDADPGWVPWLGRIVSLHFVPAAELPPPLPPRSPP